MPFNGTGMFVRVRNWVADAAAGVKIRADYHDIEDDGFADGLSHCIAKDGQTVVTQNIPMNSKRIVSLADPVDPQDAVTKAYDDLKLPLTGGTITGNLTVTGSIKAIGYNTRAGVTGSFGTSVFNFNSVASNLEAWVDSTNLGALATQAFATNAANTAAAAAAAPKVNRAGDTMTGGLTVNGEFVAAPNYVRFGYAGSPGYIIWSGGGSYSLGGGGQIWHTGNLNPVTGARWVDAGSAQVGSGWYIRTGWAVNGLYWVPANNGAPPYLGYINWIYLQVLTPGGYVTVG